MHSAARVRAFEKQANHTPLSFYQLWMMAFVLTLTVLHAVVLYNVYNGSNSVQTLAVDARKTGALTAAGDLSAYLVEVIRELREVHASTAVTDAVQKLDDIANRLAGVFAKTSS